MNKVNCALNLVDEIILYLFITDGYIAKRFQKLRYQTLWYTVFYSGVDVNMAYV